jgi:hypothetical protein
MDAIKCKTFLADPSINPLTGRKIDPTGATAKKLQKECKGLVKASPKPKAASPKPKAASPKPKAASPKPKSASPKPKAASPKPKSASPKPKPKPKALDPRLHNQVIVFSGFRSKEIEASLATVNCKVATSISKKTLLVVAKDPSDVTGKVAKAREYGIPVLSLDSFKEQYMDSTAPAAAHAPAQAQRMPNIWTYDPSQYDNESEYMDAADMTEKYFTSIKNKTVPGDFIAPEDGYRGEGVMIVGLNKKLMAPEPHGNGEVSFPAKAFKMLLDQGLTVDDVIKAYKQSQFTFLIYPMSHQKKLVHKKKGPWSGKLRIYDVHGEFTNKGGDAEVDLDEFDFLYTWDKMGLEATM